MSITAFTAKAIAPTKIGRPVVPCTSVAPVCGVVKAVAGVMGFGDDRIERRAIERRVHLVGDLDQAAIEHRKQDRIDSHSLILLRLVGAKSPAALDHFRRSDQAR